MAYLYKENPNNYLEHHGIKNQKWGVRHGPPYPLNANTHNKVVAKGQDPLKGSLTQAEKEARKAEKEERKWQKSLKSARGVKRRLNSIDEGLDATRFYRDRDVASRDYVLNKVLPKQIAKYGERHPKTDASLDYIDDLNERIKEREDKLAEVARKVDRLLAEATEAGYNIDSIKTMRFVYTGARYVAVDANEYKVWKARKGPGTVEYKKLGEK